MGHVSPHRSGLHSLLMSHMPPNMGRHDMTRNWKKFIGIPPAKLCTEGSLYSYPKKLIMIKSAWKYILPSSSVMHNVVPRNSFCSRSGLYLQTHLASRILTFFSRGEDGVHSSVHFPFLRASNIVRELSHHINRRIHLVQLE